MASFFDFIFMFLGIFVAYKGGFIVYEFLYMQYLSKKKNFEKDMEIALYSDHIASEKYGLGVSILVEDTQRVQQDYPEKQCTQIFEFFFALRELNVNFVYLKPVGKNHILYKSACAGEGTVLRGIVQLQKLH